MLPKAGARWPKFLGTGCSNQGNSMPWLFVWNLNAVLSVENPTAFKILETMVDKDRIRGSAEQAKGKVKEVVGKIAGDSKLESEGKADQFKGKVKNAVGGLNSAGQVISLAVGPGSRDRPAQLFIAASLWPTRR
jgi:uncharacterized protein YjbJ (UPF0337 family)